MSLPTQHTVNMDDPEEHVLWALVGMSSEAPLLMPLSIMRTWSKHLYRCGFRHHPDCQEIRYEPPRADSSLMESVAGQWVDITDDATSRVDAAIDGLGEEVIARIVERFGKGGV